MRIPCICTSVHIYILRFLLRNRRTLQLQTTALCVRHLMHFQGECSSPSLDSSSFSSVIIFIWFSPVVCLFTCDYVNSLSVCNCNILECTPECFPYFPHRYMYKLFISYHNLLRHFDSRSNVIEWMFNTVVFTWYYS